jgi:O-antigen/teichoic acid export membrane protein
MLIAPPRWRSPYTVAAVCRAGVQASSLLGMLFAVAELDPKTFGAFSVAWVTTVIANSLLYSGSYEYLLRVDDIEHAKHSVFWVMFSQAVLSALVLLGGAVLAGIDGNADARTCFLMMMAVPLMTAGSAWYDGLLTRQGHAATVGAVTFAAELLGALALAAALELGWGFWALISWRIASTTIGLLGLAIFGEGTPRFTYAKQTVGETIKAALPLQGGTLISSLSTYAADLLLALRFNPAASASYRASARVAVTGSDVFIQPLRSMTWAAMGERERSNDSAGMGKIYLSQLRMLAFFAWPTLLCVSLFSSRLFATISKADWSEAGPILAILALARMSSALNFFLAPVMVCTGRSAALLRLQTIIAIISLLTLASVSLRGAIAVGYADLALSIGIASYSTHLVCKLVQVRISEVLQALLPACFAGLACASLGELAFRYLTLMQPLRLGLSISVMGACLLACFLLLRGRLAIRLPGGSVASS